MLQSAPFFSLKRTGLVRSNVINRATRQHILTTDAAQGPELAKAYAEARGCASVADLVHLTPEPPQPDTGDLV